MRILSELESLGYEIEVKGGTLKLFFRGEGEPDKDKVAPLINELRSHKGEVIREIQKTTIEDVELMPLDTFAKANLEVKVESTVVGEVILFVSNDEIGGKLKDEGFVVYTADELKTIVKLNPNSKGLKAIHEVKNIFPGSKVIQ